MAGDHLHELVDLLLAFGRLAAVYGVAHACLDVRAEDQPASFTKRGLRRRDLQEHVDAVALFLDHPRHSPHLTSDFP